MAVTMARQPPLSPSLSLSRITRTCSFWELRCSGITQAPAAAAWLSGAPRQPFTATVYNNTLNGCSVDFDDGCAGGAMWIQGSHVTHNELATYQSNVARAGPFGGAVAVFPYAFGSKQVNSSFTANKMVAFIGNEGPIGGAIYTARCTVLLLYA
ncbi:hypothetical protein OEZ86_009046 [Tetradesmus obliquus]|nr:hypothetical protein OEZ86_009046 [Tetradesmus obliquus]